MPHGSHKLYRFAVIALLTAVVAMLALMLRNDLRPDAVAPVPLDRLGLAVDHAERSALVAESLPAFRIVGAAADEDNSRRNVRLWEAVLAVRGGHLPNVPQQIGDCVSFGAANACNYLLCVRVSRDMLGEIGEFRPAFPPFLYGASRITIGAKHGSRFSGDGSVGAYAAEAARDLGILPADHPQCPPYSGDVARQWGRTGPPQWALDAAREAKVGSVAIMKSADDVRDAICNGYPVTIASNWGTKTIRPQDSRNVAKHDASWGHQMVVIAFDGSTRQPYWYVLNSWGPTAHPAPLQGEPPGGFWIDRQSLDHIVRQGDSWAFSAFDGFPASELDLDRLRPRRRDAAEKKQTRAGRSRPLQGSKT